MFLQNVSKHTKQYHDKDIQHVVICTVRTNEAAYDNYRKQQSGRNRQHLGKQRKSEILNQEKCYVRYNEGRKDCIYQGTAGLKQKRARNHIVHLETGQDNRGCIITRNTKGQQNDNRICRRLLDGF